MLPGRGTDKIPKQNPGNASLYIYLPTYLIYKNTEPHSHLLPSMSPDPRPQTPDLIFGIHSQRLQRSSAKWDGPDKRKPKPQVMETPRRRAISSGNSSRDSVGRNNFLRSPVLVNSTIAVILWGGDWRKKKRFRLVKLRSSPGGNIAPKPSDQNEREMIR